MRRLSGFVLILIAMPLSAQEKERTGQPIEVRFADDSIVKMVLSEPSLTVATRYGPLTIPAVDVRRIDFGARLSSEAAQKIDAAIAKLGSGDSAERESAAAELLTLRELALPALRRVAGGTNPQLVGRIAELLRTLTELIPPERLQSPEQDTIVTAEFTIVGRIETEGLKARSPYFGETTLKIADIRGLRLLGDEITKMLTIDVGGAGGGWIDAGIELRSGTSLQISAGGSAELRSPDGSVTRITPEGLGRAAAARNFGGNLQPGAAFPGGGFNPARRGGAAFNPGGLSPGALIGRIGDRGQIFVIGSRFEGPAPEEGKLFLRVLNYPDGGEMSGSYSVRLSTGK